jgi:hypothetical protein
VSSEIIHTFLANAPEALQDAQARRVGEGQEVVAELVSRAGQKHKGSFMGV